MLQPRLECLFSARPSCWVAIKEIKLDSLNRKLRESLESEISVLQRSRHDNIIKLHEIIKEKTKIYLVLEYCAGGDVSEFIRRSGRASEATARHFMIQIAAGLQAGRPRRTMRRNASLPRRSKLWRYGRLTRQKLWRYVHLRNKSSGDMAI